MGKLNIEKLEKKVAFEKEVRWLYIYPEMTARIKKAIEEDADLVIVTQNEFDIISRIRKTNNTFFDNMELESHKDGIYCNSYNLRFRNFKNPFIKPFVCGIGFLLGYFLYLLSRVIS